MYDYYFAIALFGSMFATGGIAWLVMSRFTKLQKNRKMGVAFAAILLPFCLSFMVLLYQDGNYDILLWLVLLLTPVFGYFFFPWYYNRVVGALTKNKDNKDTSDNEQ